MDETCSSIGCFFSRFVCSGDHLRKFNHICKLNCSVYCEECIQKRRNLNYLYLRIPCMCLIHYPTHICSKLLSHTLLLNQWIGKKCKYNMKFRVSRDWYAAYAFYYKYDLKGPQSPKITIILW